MTDDEFQRLTVLYLEDAILESDLERLNWALATDPERVEQFNDLRLMIGLIHEHRQDLEIEGGGGERLPASSAVPDPLKVRLPVSNRRRWLSVLSIAGAALLIIAWGWIARPESDLSTQSVATLSHVSHAQWEANDRQPGDRVGAGVLQLKVGMARLDFDNGATVTLQGPAKMEVVSGDQARLQHGILTASIPESAIGFEVVTPAVEVVDLGTSFGVSVGMDGATDVCVFQGEVKVGRSDDPANRNRQRLKEGKAVRWNPDGNVLEAVSFDAQRYRESWPLTSGVLQATGLMKFVSPGPEFVPGKYEDNSQILVFQERTEFATTEEIVVDLVEPGMYQRIHRTESHRIPVGTRLRSYLVQLDPVGRLAKSAANKPRVMGQVTFDRPILGLIASSNKLSATDRPLGHPQGIYVKTRRGIEPPFPHEGSDAGRDVVILSDDRRSLSVDLSAGTAIDQIRVIVQGKDGP